MGLLYVYSYIYIKVTQFSNLDFKYRYIWLGWCIYRFPTALDLYEYNLVAKDQAHSFCDLYL